MINGFLDIPFTELKKYWEAAKKKKKICKVIPQGRFNFNIGGKIVYTGLVCKSTDMGGKCTGVGADWCRNCVLKETK